MALHARRGVFCPQNIIHVGKLNALEWLEKFSNICTMRTRPFKYWSGSRDVCAYSGRHLVNVSILTLMEAMNVSWNVVCNVWQITIYYCILRFCIVCFSFTRNINATRKRNKGSKTLWSWLKCFIFEFGWLLNCDNVQLPNAQGEQYNIYIFLIQ